MASIAQELVNIIQARPYKDIIAALPEGAGISERLFCKTRISRYYWLDTKRFIDGSYMNPNAMFELFGDFSGDDSMTVRKNMLRSMGITKPDKAVDSEIIKNAWIPLHMKGITAKDWAESMLSSDTPGDEIALYALCKLYDRHCLVYTSANIWSTLATDKPMEENVLSGMCDIHLMYIEPGCYGELKGRPFLPAPLEGTTVSNKQDNCDSPNLVNTLSSLTESHQNVTEQASTGTGTVQGMPVSSTDIQSMPVTPSKSDSTTQIKECITPDTTIPNPAALSVDPHTEENLSEAVAIGDNSSGIGHNIEHRIIPCSVEVLKLSALECEKWLNPSTTIGGYKMRNRKIQEIKLTRKAKQNVVYQWSNDESSENDTGSSTIEAPSKSFRPTRGPSESRMSAQRWNTKDECEAAEGLLALQYASDDSTSTVSTDDNDSGNSSDDSSDNVPLSKLKDKISTKMVIDESDDSSDNVPLSKLKDKISKKEVTDKSEGSIKKGAFVKSFHGLKKYKRKRNFACSNCDFNAGSQGELNRHYLNTHGNLTCEKCGKTCRTLSAYLKHKYEHSDISRKYPCDNCDKAFPFSSQLKNHRKVHLIALEHHCLHCNKSYKSKGELVKHQNKHSNKTWSCDKCTYTADDPRNLRAHKNKHGNKTRYKCELCSEGFNYYQQIKRHHKKGCSKQ